MKASVLFWASTALAQGLRQATASSGAAESTPVPWYPSPEEEVSECTANLVAELCDYKKPISGTAVASSGPKNCWEYCNEHKPCNFVIFVEGNPYTGTGTCWVYPGEDFDPSLGEEGCDRLSVFDKPVCPTPTPTPTDGAASACAATESPSAIAAVCDYPAPETPCFYDCYASSGAVHCLSLCADADECAYAVFTPTNPALSPYYSGGCSLYRTGSFDESKAKKCDTPEQYVYKNPCPKPPKPSTTRSSSSATSTSTSTSGSGSSSDDNPEDNSSSGGGSSSSGGSSSDGNDSSSGDESNGSSNNAEAQGAKNGDTGKGDKSGAAATRISLGGLLAAALAAFIW